MNEQESIALTIVTLTDIVGRMVEAQSIASTSFVLVVDDGSTDDTWDIVSALSTSDQRVTGLRLSRNFGHQAAVLAGISSVSNLVDASISIDADLQQDPSAIVRFVAEFSSGSDVVLGVRKDRATDTLSKRATACGFYKLMRLMGVDVVPNHADYRLLSRRAMEALLSFRETNLFLRGLSSLLGFKTSTVFFDVKDREFGESKYNVRRMLRFAVHAITSFSVVPLRLVFACGVLCFLISLIMVAYIVGSTLMGDTVPGWASTTLPIYVLAGIQLLCLGIVGEYVGKIYSTVQQRPRWIVWEATGQIPIEADPATK